MARFLEKYAYSGNNTGLTQGSVFGAYSSSTSFVATVVKIDTDRGLASIYSDVMGEEAQVPYQLESGIRVGSSVRVSTASNIPRITNVINFGNEDTAVLSFKQDDEFFSAYKGKNIVADYDELSGHSSLIKHNDGEKVFASDFSGLIAGISDSILFFEANSRFRVSDKRAEVIANNITLFGTGGYMDISEPEPDGDWNHAGFCESICEVKQEEDEILARDIILEMKGDVSGELKKKNIVIPSIPGSNFNINKAVYLMMIINRKKKMDDFELDTKTVTHKYANRKLTIDGSRGDDITLNSQLTGKAYVRDDLLKYRALEVKEWGESVPVTYLKAISEDGDVVEFSSGKKEEASFEKMETSFIRETRNSIGIKEEFFQDNCRTVQYPIKEKSTIYTELFGNNISEYKGDYKSKRYRYSTELFINTNVVFEVDLPSGIKTAENVKSPIVFKSHVTKIEEYKKEPLLADINPMLNIALTKDSDKISLSLNPVGGIFGNISNGSDSTKIFFSSKTISFITGDFVVKADSSILNSELIYLKAENIMMKGSIFSDGSLFFKAKDVFFDSESSIVFHSKNLYALIEKNGAITYKDNFYILSQAEDQTTPGGEDKVKTAIIMDGFNMYMQSDGTQIYGREFINAFAKENGIFGAKNAIFYGSQQGGV